MKQLKNQLSSKGLVPSVYTDEMFMEAREKQLKVTELFKVFDPETDVDERGFYRRPVNAKSLAQRGLAYGVGINDADYRTSIYVDGKKVYCPISIGWRSMIKRIFDPALHERHPTYIGCSIDPSWLTFSIFESWIRSQLWQGRALDKDLLIPNNKKYGPDRCIMVPQWVNTLMNDRGAARGDFAIGVIMIKERFRSNMSLRGKTTRLGVFDTEVEAHVCYLLAKSYHVMSILPDLATEDVRLVPALRRIAEDLEKQANEAWENQLILMD